MDTQEFINLCHEAQHDAGSQSRFNQKVTAQRDKLEDVLPTLVDPVAAFIAAILINAGTDIEQAKEDFGFYAAELNRVATALR